MIWIEENDTIVGYVPVLKKEYTDDEIREMSKHCQSQYKGWSKLSALVMHIQGISYAYVNQAPTVHCFEAPFTLYDVSSDFDYECFWGYPDLQTKSYTKQIFDVFENLTLYKVDSYSISDLSKQVNEMTNHLSRFIEIGTKISICSDFKKTLSMANVNAKNIECLFNLFSKNKLILTHNIFQEADDTTIEKLQQQRDLRRERLLKSIHD